MKHKNETIMKTVAWLLVSLVIFSHGVAAQRDGRGSVCESRADCSSRTDDCAPYPDGKRYCVAREAGCAWPSIAGVGADAMTCIGAVQYVCGANRAWTPTGQACPGAQQVASAPQPPEPAAWSESVAVAAAADLETMDTAVGIAPPPAPAPVNARIAPLPAGHVPADHVVVYARANSWMKVTDRAGNVVLNRILVAGESWVVPARRHLLLTTGNAGGTEIRVDGVALPKLGESGAVRRDIVLDDPPAAPPMSMAHVAIRR